MSSNQSQGGTGGAQHDPSTTLGIGRRTSGEAGATCTHETMAETGGSGGPGLTQDNGLSRQDEEARARQAAGESTVSTTVREGSDQASGQASDQDKDAARSGPYDSGARGFQDTRSKQAGVNETGLGTPETGANQEPADLERQRKDRPN